MRHILMSLIFALGLVLPLAAPAQDAAMSDSERAAFRAEVRAYLLENPEILAEMITLLEAGQQEGEGDDSALVAENADAIFDDGYSHVGGNPDGDFTIVEFVDYQCGFCRRSHPEMRELVESDGNIRLIVKEFPILGPGSDLASRAAIATLIDEGPEAYERLNDALMGLEGPVTDASLERALKAADLEPEAIRARLDDPEITRRIDETNALARDLAISGTPTFVFESEMLRGYVPLKDMRAVVAELRPGD